MKRVFSFCVALIILSLSSVSAFAVTKPQLPICQIIADCATFKTFSHSNLGLSDKEIFKRALGSSGVVLSGTTSDGKQCITFVSIFSDITDLKLIDSNNSTNPLKLSSVLGFSSLHFTYNVKENIWEKNSLGVTPQKFSYLLHNPMILKNESTVDYDVFTHYLEKTFVTDDSQFFHAENKKVEVPEPPEQEEPLPTKPEVPVEPEKPTENNGILNWLSGFWDKLKNMFLSIFIPPEGYFDSWISDIKNAWNVKMQNLNALRDLLKAFFEDMNISKADTSLMFNIPANHFYSGSPAIKTDLLQTALPYCKFVKPVFNGFIGILTLIACYKRLVKLFDH